MDFPSYIYNGNHLNQEKINELLELLSIDNRDYLESQVYVTSEKKNIIEKTVRSSKKIEYKDEQLFNWVNTNCIQNLNTDTYRFILIHNDITVIKYNQGDFFKKHQDFVTLHSNEFYNYTFVVCLHACEDGGETLLYDSQDTAQSFITGKKQGSILVFPKDTFHEGKMIEKGTKIILSGNLICLKNKDPLDLENNEEYLIVMLNDGKTPYILSIAYLRQFHPQTMYISSYDFKKSSDPNHDNIQYHIEKELTNEQFQYFYKQIQNNNDFAQLSELNNKLNYIGFKDDSVSMKFINYVNGDSEKTFLCKPHNYNKLLKLIANEESNILPFQLIYLSNVKCVIWFGVYDELFGTRDYILNDKVCDWNCNNDVGNVPSCNRIKHQRIRQYIKNQEKLDMNTINKYIHYEDDNDLIIDGYCDNAQSATYQYIWNYHRMKHISKISTYPNLESFLISIISDLPAEQFGREPSIIIDKPSPPKFKIKYNNDMLAKLDINKIITNIKAIPTVSTFTNKGYSYFCNESDYDTYNVIYKYGFYKVDENDYINKNSDSKSNSDAEDTQYDDDFDDKEFDNEESDNESENN
jgi:hypothetical protein